MSDGPWLTKTLRVQRRCGKSESDCSEEIGWLDENEQHKALVGRVQDSGVVVSVNKLNSSCRVAVAQGLLHRAYAYHALKLLPTASNNIDLNNLRDAYENYRSLPKVTEREAARFVSSVGGQGIVHCNCRCDCTKNSCSCKKANWLCSSRCHRNNNKCKNKHDDDVDCGK